jgi:electron transport complex protein RnfB
MNVIILATVIVAVIGLILGLGLSVASEVMAVPADEKAEAVEEVLPGANCGACGFSGCGGYASALSKGETTECNRCVPGGAETAQKVGAIMGLSVGSIEPMTAMVRCGGTHENAGTILNYTGDQSCKTSAQLFSGPKACNYGCLGFGDCERACPYDAIKVCDGVARVDPDECKACGVCIKTCPKHMIELVPKDKKVAVVFCLNKDKGGITKKACKVGCIGCGKCQKNCESGAITVTDNVAHVDYNKCTGCGKCVDGCPSKCIKLIDFGA